MSSRSPSLSQLRTAKGTANDEQLIVIDSPINCTEPSGLCMNRGITVCYKIIE